jgi:hypothetical protein
MYLHFVIVNVINLMLGADDFELSGLTFGK